MNNYKKAFTEVQTILDCLDESEYSKIPYDIIDTINKNVDEKYQYNLVEDLELKYQPMLPETKAILFNLFRDYLSTPEQKQKIIRMQREDRYKNEQKKMQIYDINVFKDKRK